MAGFTFRCEVDGKVGDEGLESYSLTSIGQRGLGQPSKDDDAESDAFAPISAVDDAAFLELAELWPALPDTVKTDIMRLARRRGDGSMKPRAAE
jgi:hypothetical protein